VFSTILVVDQGEPMSRLIYLAFFLSGISGLVYQVVWVKWFSRIFGNSLHSASLVVSVFMCGLGLGSYLVGRWSDRRAAGDSILPLRMYGYAEIAIGLLGGLLALLLPALEPLAATISSYQAGPEGWFELSRSAYAARYALAVLLLAPVTILMGGTLTLLIRYLLVHDLSLAGWRVGLLYGINTLGAATGAFATDLLLIPSVGLLAAQALAVAFNLAAAALALRLVSPRREMPASVPAGPPPEARELPASVPAGPPPEALRATPEDAHLKERTAVSLAILCSGFAAMGLEIIWYRYLAVLLGGYQSVFSLLLTCMLAAMWLGSTAGGWMQRRLRRPLQIFIVTQALLALSAVLLLVLIDPEVTRSHFAALARAHQAEPAGASRLWHTLVNLRIVLALCGLPAFLMGFAYPLANAAVQRTKRHIGGRAGTLYLANTIGAVAGSAATGFILIPWLGMQNSLTVLVCFCLASVAAIAMARRAGRASRPLVIVAAPAAAAIAAVLLFWVTRPPDLLVQRAVPASAGKENVLAVSEGVYEIVAVTQQPDGSRKLITNGHSMSGNSRWGQRYMRAFSHVPLLHLEEPTDALVICFGVGSTLHAASLHPTLRRIELVDLSRHVLEHAHHFAATNRHVLKEDRVHVYVNDGRLHLHMARAASYDLVTLEPPPISHAGVSALYTREFYALVRSRLKEGGFFSHWLPGYQVPGEILLSMVRAFVEVFPNAFLLSGAGPEMILIGSRGGPITLDLDRYRRRLAANETLRADLESIYFSSLLDIVGSYAAGPRTLAAATEGVAPVTDDYPILEYAVASQLFSTHMPPELFDNRTVMQWCPACFTGDGVPIPALAGLAGYLAAMQAYFHSEAFLTYRNIESGPAPPVPLPRSDAVREAFHRSPFLQAFFARP